MAGGNDGLDAAGAACGGIRAIRLSPSGWYRNLLSRGGFSPDLPCISIHEQAKKRPIPQAVFGGFDYENTWDVPYNCDLREMINRLQPQLILICAIDEAKPKGEVELPRNSDYEPGIARLGLITGDTYSPAYYAAYNMLRQMGCHAAFCNKAVPHELLYEMPDLPVFYYSVALGVNYAGFHDYAEEKIYPVGLFGRGFFAEASGHEASHHYPWRKEVTQKILSRINFVATAGADMPRLVKNAPALQGERYARTINRCYTAFACGGEVRTLLSKHIEIPACRTCLVTEESAIVKAHGFEDMVNCVFATPQNILDKLEFLFGSQNKLKEITDAGCELAQRILASASQQPLPAQWYHLYCNRKPGQKVVQTGVFQLALTELAQPDPAFAYGQNILKDTWMTGFSHLRENKLAEAEAAFHQAFSYVGHCPEARVGRAICEIFRDRLGSAQAWFSLNFQQVQKYTGYAGAIDPVELAYLGVLLLSQNLTGNAEKLLLRYPGLNHPALSAVWALLRNDAGLLSDKRSCLSRLPVEDFSVQHWHQHFSTIIQYVSAKITSGQK